MEVEDTRERLKADHKIIKARLEEEYPVDWTYKEEDNVMLGFGVSKTKRGCEDFVVKMKIEPYYEYNGYDDEHYYGYAAEVQVVTTSLGTPTTLQSLERDDDPLKALKDAQDGLFRDTKMFLDSYGT